MHKYSLLMSLWIVLLLGSCSSGSNNDGEQKAIGNTQDSTALGSTIVDTSFTDYTTRIINDTSVVRIRRINNGNSDAFTIFLFRAGKEVLAVDIDKTVLIDSNKTKLFKDSVNLDFTTGALVKNIEYHGIRSNTLYFKTILENKAAGKEILGRFNLYYGAARKGEVYGWITDRIRTT